MQRRSYTWGSTIIVLCHSRDSVPRFLANCKFEVAARSVWRTSQAAKTLSELERVKVRSESARLKVVSARNLSYPTLVTLDGPLMAMAHRPHLQVRNIIDSLRSKGVLTEPVTLGEKLSPVQNSDASGHNQRRIRCCHEWAKF